jgi:hypothetical protein
MQNGPDKPWYRHFWVWFMLAPLIAAVIASVVTLYLAGPAPAVVESGSAPAAARR